MSDKRLRDANKRRDRRKVETRPFSQAPPIILDRRERSDTQDDAKQPRPSIQPTITTPLTANALQAIPFMRRPNKFNTDVILKNLTDHPGHFVIGILGKQGVGKSTILSHFTQDPEHTFPTQSKQDFLIQGHKTEGIDMYMTPERAILLDTEPIGCWTVLDQALRTGLGGLHPDVWLEMDSLYNVIFLYSVCNVVLVVNEGPQIDNDLLRLLKRADMLKFLIPDFPLLAREQQDMHVYPDLVFVCNNCHNFTFAQYDSVQRTIKDCFAKSQLRTSGLVSMFDQDVNAFFLPPKKEDMVESFEVLMEALRDQVVAAPRKSGKKGQVSEKDWYRNAIKVFELIRKSEYIHEYLQTVRKLKDA